MKKIKVMSLFVALLFMHWDNVVLAESAHTFEAKVIGAMQRKDNPYMAVVKNEDTKSGWYIDIKKNLSDVFTDKQLIVLFYIKTDPKAELEEAFGNTLCSVMNPYGRDTNILPEQIGHMMFPKQKGNCNFTESEYPIRATAQVNTNPDDNEDLLVKTPPYELEVRVIRYDFSEADYFDPNDYFFKVNFNIGGDINKN